MTASPEISLIIPTLGRLTLLQRGLERLSGQRGNFEVVIAADARHDGLPELDGLLEERAFPVRRVQAGIPGASAARNAGWRAARTSLLLFLDDDILPEAGLVRQHLDWHARHPEPEVGVLGRVRWADELTVTPFMRWLEQGIQFDYPAIERDGPTWGHFYTANVSVKRAIVERAGGFDEQRLPFGYEDLDLALRMHEATGFRLLYNPDASAEHVHPMDIDFWQRRVTRIAVSERSFVALHPEVPAYFHDRLSDAAARPPVARPSDGWLRLLPAQVPFLGARLWARADMFYRQALAGPFLTAWAAEAGAQPASAGPPASAAGAESDGP
jgi:GT2 family glycosyltransferase